jgi:hypothetical protein
VSRGFAKEEHEGSTLQLVNSRVASSAKHLALAGGYAWKVITRRSHTHIAFLGIGIGRKRSRGSSTHELARSRVAEGVCAKTRLWSYGGVRLAPSVKLHREGFHERPMDQIREVPIGI